MSSPASQADQRLKTSIVSLLAEGRIMSVGTLRPDGWPQVTTVGYINDDLVLYFAVASTSQKYLNTQRDPRVSIAVAIGPDSRRQARGLSMAALASQVVDPAEVERINRLLSGRYFGHAIFAPRGPSAVVLRADPIIISLADDSDGCIEPQIFEMSGCSPERPAN
jgi:hypothetical protein